MCRKTFTEYCHTPFTYDGPTDYCTNGGKCVLDKNKVFIECVCNKNFEGPHCEFLKLDENWREWYKSTADEQVFRGARIVLPLLAVFALAVAFLAYRRHRRRVLRSNNKADFFHNVQHFWMPEELVDEVHEVDELKESEVVLEGGNEDAHRPRLELT
jgi:hypothetical protein